MENRDLENKIASVVCDIVPEDAFEKISERIAKGDVPERSNVKLSKFGKVKKVLFPVAAACIFLVVSVVLGLNYYNNNYSVDYIVDIDVNPSIEISVNKKDKVLDVVALNDDAKAIIDGISFEKCDLDKVVDAIMSKLVDAGYVESDEDAGILVTVQNKDIKKADRVRSKVVNNIDKKLEEKNIDATVMGQSLSDIDSAKEFAEKNDISVGRAMFIKKVSAKNPEVKPEDLVGMPMKDIVSHVKHKNIDLDEIVDCGKHHNKGNENKPENDEMPDQENENKPENNKQPDKENAPDTEVSVEVKISKDEAKNIAIADADVSAEDVTFKNVKLTTNKNGVIYKVIFTVGETEYFYEINANDGSILKANSEAVNESDSEKNPEAKPQKPVEENESDKDHTYEDSVRPEKEPSDKQPESQETEDEITKLDNNINENGHGHQNSHGQKR